MITEQDINKGLDEAFIKAGQNAYFGNGFMAGVKFVLEFKQKNNKKLQTDGLQSECSDDCNKCEFAGGCKDFGKNTPTAEL